MAYNSKMANIFSYSQILTLILFFSPLLTRSFTIIMSDSGSASTLVDGPQTEFSMNNDGAKTDAAEQEAVYEVMRATGNDWATEIPDVCRGRWHGIECMPDRDDVLHVVSLSFGALSDDTAFPTCDSNRSHISPSVTKLPHLRSLFFYRCLTNNPRLIPTFLGQLGPNLQTLVLRENGHVGRIPNELGNLTRLRVLDLHKNNLNGSVPDSLSRISGLWSLDLSSNTLTGPVPGLASPGLRVIDLSQNHLEGPIPPGLFSKCHSLIKLDMSRNRLTGPIPERVGSSKELVLLDLSYNRLSGPLPESLKSLVSLQALILKGNPIGSESETIRSDGFEGMKSLAVLVLSNMDFHGPIPSSLAQLSTLRVLHLDGNHFNGSIPTSFGELVNLSELRLNDNWLTGVVPLGREMAWRMRKKLRLYNNSGLCFTPNSGLEDYLDSSFSSGIGPCGSEKPGSVRSTVQHFVASDESDVYGSEEVLYSSATTKSLRINSYFMALCLLYVFIEFYFVLVF